MSYKPVSYHPKKKLENELQDPNFKKAWEALDDEFAANTRFGKRIAHGMLSGAFISAVLGYELSDRKIVYLSQTLKFTHCV